MSQRENSEKILKLLSHRQTLVQKQEWWAVFHSSSSFFFYSLPFFNPESCFVFLFCFEAPCPSPYETWEALAEFSLECSSWDDRCSPLPCKSFDFPASQFSLGNKWTQIVFKQHSLILAFVSEGWLRVCWSRLVLPEWFCLKLKVQMDLASHWFGAHVRSMHIDCC